MSSFEPRFLKRSCYNSSMNDDLTMPSQYPPVEILPQDKVFISAEHKLTFEKKVYYGTKIELDERMFGASYAERSSYCT